MKAIEPALGLDSFSCPHCGALAHQYWFDVLLKDISRERKPRILDPSLVDRDRIGDGYQEEEKKRVLAFFDRLVKNTVTVDYLTDSSFSRTQLVNFQLSKCHSCDGYSAWAVGRLIYPDHIVEFIPADDMPNDVRTDFIEASSIFGKSPRGAAALLRLCIQRLMIHLGQDGKNLNNDIHALVANGLNPTIQKALDVVRVTGNNAVHPGTMDLNDTPETAGKLFSIVNVIVQSMISTPKQIDSLYEDLPPGAKAAIERRDGEG